MSAIALIALIGEVRRIQILLPYRKKQRGFSSLWILRVKIKYGYILKNEDGDISQELKTIFSRYPEDFTKLKYDVNDIRLPINV